MCNDNLQNDLTKKYLKKNYLLYFWQCVPKMAYILIKQIITLE